MQLFRLPNRKQVYGVNFEQVGSRLPSSQSPQQQREYMDLERQLRGVTALSNGLAGRRRPALGKMDVVRPGMHDRIDGVSILGGMSLRHANGRPLSLLFMSDPNTAYQRQRHMAFCVMKVPSQGAWTAQQEFVMSRGEYDLVLALLPVICDPGYDGSRTDGLAEVIKRFNIMPSSMSAIPSTDGPALNRFCSDSMGRPILVPSKLGHSPYDDDEDDAWDDRDHDNADLDEDDYDREDRREANYRHEDARQDRRGRGQGWHGKGTHVDYDEHNDSSDSSKYYDPRDVYADPYGDRNHDDEHDDGYDDGFDMGGGGDAYRIPDRPPKKKPSPVILVIAVILLIVLTFVAIFIHNLIAPQIGLG